MKRLNWIFASLLAHEWRGAARQPAMRQNSEHIPIACCLSDAALRERAAMLLAQFKSAVMATEEIPDGYAFHIPGDKNSITMIAKLIAEERECCPFLRFELTALPNMGPLIVRVTGPVGAKDFLRTILLP
jgi:hypothetical protein